MKLRCRHSQISTKGFQNRLLSKFRWIKIHFGVFANTQG